MLSNLPSWMQATISLALLGLVVVVGSRVTSKVTNKVL